MGFFHAFKRFAVLFTVLFAVLGGVLTVSASAAYADVDSDKAAAAETYVAASASDPLCAAANYTSSLMGIYGSNLLPVERWGDNVGFHSRLQLAATDPDTWVRQAGASQVSMLMGIGNGGWQASNYMTGKATNFCVGSRVYQAVDVGAGAIGNAIMNSGLLSVAVVAVFLTTLFRARRQGSGLPWQAWLRVIGCAAIILAMTAGATASKGGTPGKFSPAWISSNVQQVVSGVAMIPANALNDAAMKQIDSSASDGNWSDKRDNSLSDCRSYTQALRASYADAVASAKGGSGDVSTMTQRSLDSMWTSTGLSTWSQVQFGKNEWAQKAGCHLLDINAGIAQSNAVANKQASIPGVLTGKAASDTTTRGSGVMDMLQNVPGWERGGKVTVTQKTIPGLNPRALAFTTRGLSNDGVDAAMIGWAACKINVKGETSVEDAWKAVVTDPDCRDFFKKASEFNPSEADLKAANLYSINGSSLNLGNDLREAHKKAKQSSDPSVEDYVAALRGETAGNSVATAAVYALASWVCGFIFLVLSVLSLVCQLALVVVGFMLLWAVFAAMFRNDEATSALVTTGKRYLMLTLASFALAFIMSMLTLTTSIIMQVGASTVAGVGSSLWAAFSPIAAVVVLHLVFTKLLKIPSPLTVSGMKSYAKAAMNPGTLSLAGASAAAGSTQSLRSRFAKGAKSSAAGATNRLTAGRFGAQAAQREGGMDPAKTAVASMAGAAVGMGAAGKARDILSKHAQQKDVKRTANEADGILPSGGDLDALVKDKDAVDLAKAYELRGGNAPSDDIAEDSRLLREHREAQKASKREDRKEAVGAALGKGKRVALHPLQTAGAGVSRVGNGLTDRLENASNRWEHMRAQGNMHTAKTLIGGGAKTAAKVGAGVAAAAAVSMVAVPLAAGAGTIGALGAAGAAALGARAASNSMRNRLDPERVAQRRFEAQHGVDEGEYLRRRASIEAMLRKEQEAMQGEELQKLEERATVAEDDVLPLDPQDDSTPPDDMYDALPVEEPTVVMPQQRPLPSNQPGQQKLAQSGQQEQPEAQRRQSAPQPDRQDLPKQGQPATKTDQPVTSVPRPLPSNQPGQQKLAQPEQRNLTGHPSLNNTEAGRQPRE